MNFIESAKVARAVDAQDYNRAISICERFLQKNPKDEFAISMMASCYEWAGDYDQAIECANRLLAIDPVDFQMLCLAARYWSRNKDEERTYHYACRIVDNQPDPLPEIPRIIDSIMKFLSFIPRLRRLKEEPLGKELKKQEIDNQRQIDWAQDFKTWHESRHGK